MGWFLNGSARVGRFWCALGEALRFGVAGARRHLEILKLINSPKDNQNDDKDASIDYSLSSLSLSHSLCLSVCVSFYLSLYLCISPSLYISLPLSVNLLIQFQLKYFTGMNVIVLNKIFPKHLHIYWTVLHILNRDNRRKNVTGKE